MEQVLYEIYLQWLHDQAWQTLITSYILTYICWIDYSARQLLKTRTAYVHCWIKLFKFTLIHRGSTSMRLQHQLNFKKYYTFCPWLTNNRCSSEWIVSLKGNSTQKTNKLQMKGLIVNSSDTKFNDSNFNSRGRIHSAVFLLWRHWSASLPSGEKDRMLLLFISLRFWIV